MKFSKYFFGLFLGATLSFAFLGMAFAQGSPTGFVNDCCNILTTDEKVQLEGVLSDFQKKTSNEIAVAIVDTLDGQDMETYATNLYRTWGVGSAKNNNGVLLLFAMQEHKIRIEVGYGLEGVIPDILAGHIIQENITPFMKQSKYADAINSGITELMKASEGEYAGIIKDLEASEPEGNFGAIMNIFVFLLIFGGGLISYVVSYLARSKSIVAGGIGGGAIGLVITSLFIGFGVAGFIVIVGMAALGFILDAILSSTYTAAKASGKSTSWADTKGGFFPSSGSSSSSSSSTFGGFGGGSSGGGGASGGW